MMDYQGRPLGTDFSNVYAAGTYVLDGRPAAPFDPRLQHAREQEIFGAKTPFYGWHYPPFFLWLAGALALMPYQLALAAWQAATLVLYLLSIRALIASSQASPLWRGSIGRRPLEVGGEVVKRDVSPERPTPNPSPPQYPSLWFLLALA